jgi:hypothetical protein
MVWMCKNGLASAIITEDSDVFVYCMTSNVSAPVLFKLDDAGWTQALTRDHLFQISSKSRTSIHPSHPSMHPSDLLQTL